jgi:hypothetical protein
MPTSSSSAVSTLHFDLSHLPNDVEFTLRSSGIHYSLRRHTADTLAEHSLKNSALALIPPENQHRVTHFAEGVALSEEAVGWHWVSHPARDAQPHLPEIALVFVHVPAKSRRRAARLRDKKRSVRGVPPSLASLGVMNLPSGDTSAIEEDSWSLKTPIETTKAIISSHPDIASLNPDVAAIALEHVEQAATGSDLYNYIRSNHTTFYSKTFVTGLDGKIIEPAQNLTDKDNQPVTWPAGPNGSTPAIPQYQLSEAITGTATSAGYALPVVQQALRAIGNDPHLNGQKWSAPQGVTVNAQPAPSQSTSAAITSPLLQTTGAEWTVDFQTSQYGLDVDASSIQFDSGTNSFSINVKNWANRGLSMWVQFFDENGSAINVPGAPDAEPTLLYVELIGSGNVICGIPVWNDYKSVSFSFPTNAVTADMLFGGLGTGSGKAVVVGPGEAYTILVNYTVPIMLMIAAVGLQSTAFYMEWVAPNAGAVTLVGMAGLGLADTGLVKIADPAEVLTASAGVAAGLILSGLPSLAAIILGYETAQQFLDAVPFVGWGLKVASLAMGLSGMIATTAECAQSPAMYQVEIKRVMDVAVSVSPDPLHGIAPQLPVWPDVAATCEIILQYQGGTSISMAPALPSPRDKQISITFTQVPTAPGDFLQITANIYSSTGWLAGKWTSGWVPAVPSSGSTLTLSGSIIESLVPLTSSTVYSHMQKLIYDTASASHEWQADTTPPAALITDLSGGNTGNHLAECTNITLNDNAYACGYTWEASGQNLPLDNSTDPVDTQMFAFQNISVLAKPQSAIKQPGLGFTRTPFLVYDQFGPPPLFEVGGENGPGLDALTIPPALSSAFTAAGTSFALPSDATIIVLTAGSEWQIGETGDILYSLKVASAEDGSSIINVALYPGTFVFSLPSSTSADLDKGGTPSAAVTAAFAQRTVSYKLPGNAAVTVETAATEWFIGAGSTKLYDLKRDAGGGIQVFTYPAPAFSSRNFYLDTRPNTANLFYLRQVTLLDNENTFDYSTGMSWGAFAPIDVSAMVVHPAGFVIAIDYSNSKLQILQLPGAAVSDSDAPQATPLSGEGTREGLTSNPVAMTVTPDGRVLVLEQTTARIQAFDTLANPVQCFAGPLTFSLAPEFSADLDSGTASAAFSAAYQLNVNPQLARLFGLSSGSQPTLNAGGTVSADIIQQFAAGGITLPADSTVSVTANGLWLLNDTDDKISFDLRYNRQEDEVDVFYAATFAISTIVKGGQWLVRDKTNSITLEVIMASDQSALDAKQLVATMALYDSPVANIQYLDIAVESKSFIYVLSYLPPGDMASQYHLDIYNPDGSWLARTAGVNGAKSVVDQWRNLYTLNYEAIAGPGGRTEPSVSTWIPSTPKAASYSISPSAVHRNR